MQTLTLADGTTLPAFGLGTWKSARGEVYDAVKEALSAGYRHIDCAKIYGNEGEVGTALSDTFAVGEIRRDEVWVTSKLWNCDHAPEDVEDAVRGTLEDLQLEYLDLYLIHWPVALKKGVLFPRGTDDFRSLEEVPLASTWQAMQALKDKGLVRQIGVSNFSVGKIDALIDATGITPAMNQVELHPFHTQQPLVDAMKARGIGVTAYSPLGSRDRAEVLKSDNEPVLLEHSAVATIAEAHGVSPAQVLIAWALARGTAVIPKSTNPGRIRENLAATEITLTDDEVATLSGLDRGFRYVDGSFWARPGSGYTLESLWG